MNHFEAFLDEKILMFCTDYTNTSMNNLRHYWAWFKGKFRVAQGV